jgi:hypothetical protein
MDNGSAEGWLTTFTTALRAKLPQGMFASRSMDGVSRIDRMPQVNTF